MGQDQLTYFVIGEAMWVHRELGPAVPEMFHHRLLSERLKAGGVEHRLKPREALVHRGHTADIFEADLIVPGQLILELKRHPGELSPSHYLQLKSYLKFWGIRIGLLLNFGSASLAYQRYAFTDLPAPSIDLDSIAPPACSHAMNRTLILSICSSLQRVCATYGLGYRDTTYRGLVVADLRAEGLRVVAEPPANICTGGRTLGVTNLSCLAVQDECAVMALSLRQGIRPVDRAVLQSCLHHLGFPWGVVAHFGKRDLEVLWVRAPTPTR